MMETGSGSALHVALAATQHGDAIERRSNNASDSRAVVGDGNAVVRDAFDTRGRFWRIGTFQLVGFNGYRMCSCADVRHHVDSTVILAWLAIDYRTNCVYDIHESIVTSVTPEPQKPMSEFSCKVRTIEVLPHPDADRLELAAVDGYRCVVRKGDYETDDEVVYIPEGAVLPHRVIAELGLEGRLAGGNKDRVKAVKLRGALSQGLVYPVDGGFVRGVAVKVGDDVAGLLGIEKYEPPVPIHMAGQVKNAYGATIKYDIENIKSYEDAFVKGDGVVFTEKIHGTWFCMGWHPDHGRFVTSKGLSARGLVFADSNDNKGNLYVMTAVGCETEFESLRSELAPNNEPFYVLGEIFGRGVQDLHYGMTKPAMAVFDIRVGGSGDGRYIDAEKLDSVIGGRFAAVPTLYAGPFDNQVLDEWTNGRTTFGDNHVREGVVIKPIKERRDERIGRLILKSVSGDYATRKGGTEYN